MSPEGNRCHGVLKFENKRSEWASLKHGEYLTSIIPLIKADNEKKRICTPKIISSLIQKCEAIKQKTDIQQLADQLAHHVHQISYFDSPLKSQEHPLSETPELLSKEYILNHMESIKWCVESLHHELDQISKITTDKYLLELQELTHSFRLSLNTYIPFSADDFHLAQALGQIIGMALVPRLGSSFQKVGNLSCLYLVEANPR